MLKGLSVFIFLTADRREGTLPVQKEKGSANTETHPQALNLSRVLTNEINTMELSLSQLIFCPASRQLVFIILNLCVFV
jgi:hypothetical protein